MATKQIKPNTPGQRHRIAPVFDDVSVDKPLKSLTKGIGKSGGRNNRGRMTIRHRGGGHKRKLRIIDFKRNKFDIPAKVQTIEYDPNRTARIALLAYADGEKRYILAPNKLKIGDTVISSESAPPEVGNSLPMSKMPPGTFIHNVELTPGKGGQICRSAGTVAQMVAKTEKMVTVKLPSGEVRNILGSCFATVGGTSNPDHFNTTKGKASGGHPRSPWGQSAKGKKTRNRKKLSSKFIVRRRKTKKA